jgi:hypothetical protein
LKLPLVYSFAIFLLVAILAPPVFALLEQGEGEQIVLDFSEEEENNEKNTFEFTEKHLVDNLQSNLAFIRQGNMLSFDKNRTDLITSNTKEVSLPPPKV